MTQTRVNHGRKKQIKTRKHRPSPTDVSFPEYNPDTVIVFTPSKAAIEIANKDLKKYLYRKQVDAEKAVQEHQYLQDALTAQKQKFIDIQKFVPKNTPPEYLANLLYTRDPFIKTKKGLVLGHMRQPIRKHDTDLINKIMLKMNQPVLYRCKGDEYLEGGDYLINCDTSFVGTGARSSIVAAKKLMKMDLYGTEKVVIIRPLHPDKNMYRMHLDCVFSPFGCKQCVIWDDLIHKNSRHERLATEYTRQSNGEYKKTSKEMNLHDYLRENHYNIIPLTTESQYHYGANLLELSNGAVLVQDKETHKKIKGSIYIPFDEIHKMYGGLHCSTNTFF